ncbi:MAG: SBBP repeat-containing protein [Bacteroidota bacterium]
MGRRNLLASIVLMVCEMASSQQIPGPRVLWEQAIDAGIHQQFAILTAVTTDDVGNVYATGKIDSRKGCTDLLTIKYGPGGNKLWEARYNSPTDDEEAGVFIGVDRHGNVYVAGTSTFQDSLNAAVGILIKYNTLGQEQWVKLIFRIAENRESWSAFAVDAEGNTYVTGHREIAGSDQSDYITRKINSSGEHEWETVYAGTAGRDDRASGITVDNLGNVYVTGVSGDTSSVNFRQAYATIKYAPNGTQLWMHRYLLPESASGRIDAISIDHTGRVAISGRTDYGIVAQTIQYDTFGNIEWENIGTNFASSLAHDSDGILYLAGTTNPGWQADNLLALKYKPAGEVDWRFIRPYPTSMSFESPILKLDQTHNVIVASSLGSIFYGERNGAFLIKLSPDGTPLWEAKPPASSMLWNLHPLQGIALDHSGNIAVITMVDTVSLEQNGIQSARALKYNPDGLLLWNRTESGDGISDGSIYAMEIDDHGNAYVTGSCRNIESGLDYFTARINPSGVVEWTATYDGPLSKTDFASFIALDGDGNVYVSGMSPAYETGVDYATIKYSPRGEQLWVARHTNTVNVWWEDRVHDLLVDPTGVYVAGSAGVVKYDHAGNILWSTAKPAFAIARDVYGNIYAINETELTKRTGNGSELWTSYSTYRDEVAVDGYGDVYISRNGGGIKKFDANGHVLWGRSYGSKRILFDENSNVYLADFHRATKLTPAGTLVYSTATDFETVGDLALDNRGFLYVTGNTYLGSNWDSNTIKVSPTGSVEWITPANTAFGYRTFGVRATNQGEIIVAGQTIRSDMSAFPSITKLTEVVSDVVGENDNMPLTDGLSSNYPNPFNPKTNIGFRISRSGHVSLKVFDMLGREVAQLVNRELEPGNHTVSWNANAMASGVYFYTLSTNGVIETRRMMLLR